MISLLSMIDEILVKRKDKFGSGAQHVVFQSSKNPDRLFKVGDRGVVERWLKVFQSHPKFFPKIYRAGKMSGDDKFNYYVEIEKLNTQQVIDEWNYLEQELEVLGHVDVDSGGTVDEIFNGVITDRLKLDLKIHNKKAYDLFMKWVKFLDQVEGFVIKSGKMFLDTHKYNFGYDSQGNLKCLDI